MRVATFNIRNGRAMDGCNSWPFRRRVAAAAIAGLGADVVGLQEVYRFQLAYLARRLPGISVHGDVGRSGEGGGEMCPVLVGPSVRVSDVATRWYGNRPGGLLPDARHPRLATICRVDVGGRPVQVVNTHLDAASVANRRRSVTELLTWLDTGVPRLVIGDLNARPDSDVVRMLTDAGLRSAVPDDAPGTAHDYGHRDPAPRIDHVLVSDEWTVEAGAVVVLPGRYPSDHWPVVADVALREPGQV